MRLLTLKDYLISVGYKVTGGGDYLWECYGKNVFCLDSDNKNNSKNYTFSTGVIFNPNNSTVYQMDSWDYKKKIIYRWIHPKYRKKFLAECIQRGIDIFKDEEYKIIDASATQILRETKNVMVK